MISVVWISDTHLGLKTDDIDRTPEIIRVYNQVADYAAKNKSKAAVIGGDIFHKNNPSEVLIAQFIGVMNKFAELDIPVYIMVGNHDAVSEPDRLSCLGFIRKLKKKYPKFHLIDDIKCVEFCVADNGPVYFTFYPHITRATVANHEKFEGKTPQQYIEAKTKQIFSKVGDGSSNYVFSHLNLEGMYGAGSEEEMLKRSDVYLPESVIECKFIGVNQPTIIQGHIHKRQTYRDSVHVVGSPIFCDFGELDLEKYFLDLQISTEIGKKDVLHYPLTKCVPFRQLDIELLEAKKLNFEDIPEVKKFIAGLEKKSIIKFNVTINAENAGYDWEKIRAKIEEMSGCKVKEIIPKVIKNKVTRNPEQTSALNPKKAVELFMKTNKPPRMPERLDLAKNYIENTL